MELDCKSPDAEMRTPFSRFPQRSLVGVEHCSTSFQQYAITSVIPIQQSGRGSAFPFALYSEWAVPPTRKAPVIPSGARNLSSIPPSPETNCLIPSAARDLLFRPPFIYATRRREPTLSFRAHRGICFSQMIKKVWFLTRSNTHRGSD